MQLKKRLFLCVCTFFSSLCFIVPGVFAVTADSCNSGGLYQYCVAGRKCKTCPENCYCPKRDTPNTVACTGYADIKCSKGAMKSAIGISISQGSFGVFACPTDYPNAPAGANSIEECYVQCTPPGGQQKLKYKKVHCEAGSMLNYRSQSCTKCSTAGAHIGGNQVCTGGDFYPSCSKNQGVKDCATGEKPNSDKTACVSKEQPKQIHVAPEAPKYADCKPGQYLPAGLDECIACRDGHACVGGKMTFNKNNDQGIIKCSNDTVANSSKTACVMKTPEKVYVDCSAGKYLPSNSGTCASCPDGKVCYGGTFVKQSGDQGLRTCPEGQTPNSSKTECVTKAPEKVYVDCYVGTYLPSSSGTCAPCLDAYVCYGGTFVRQAGDQGLKACPEGQTPNSSKTECVTKEPEKVYVDCLAGTYLPSNSINCSVCRDGHACSGGTFVRQSGDQGLLKCTSDQIVSEDKSLCITTGVACKAGEYLPANEIKCKLCSGTNKYCPGGYYEVTDIEQGIFSCPFASSVNMQKSGCYMNISKDVMYYGPNGKHTKYSNQCWHIKNIEDYSRCLVNQTE